MTTAATPTVARRRRPWPLRLLKWLALTVLVVLVLGVGFAWWQWKTDRPLTVRWLYERIFFEYALDDPEMLSYLRVLPSWRGTPPGVWAASGCSALTTNVTSVCG